MNWLDELFQPVPANSLVNKTSAMVNGIEVPLAFHSRPGCDRLIILFNGAIDRKRAPDGRVFQRSSWVNELDANSLFIADPALVKRESGTIAWSQVDAENWGGNLFPQLVQAVADRLEIEPTKRLYFGSSAGGYQALVCAAADKGSSALVNNPQTDWTRYVSKSAVNATLKASFGDDHSLARLLRDAPERCRVVEWFLACKNIPSFTYLLNTASRSDVVDMAAPFERALVTLMPKIPGTEWSMHRYHNKPTGHSPLPRPATVGWINRQLAQL